MIQKRRNSLFILIVIAVMFTGFGLNLQSREIPYAIELSSESNNTTDSIQSDPDAHDDEKSNHVSQYICTTESLSTSFAIKHPSVLKFHFYPVWQPPKNC